MDSLVNGSKYGLLNEGKLCLLKNAICVMYNVRYISILDLSIFQFLISRFWYTICKLTI